MVAYRFWVRTNEARFGKMHMRHFSKNEFFIFFHLSIKYVSHEKKFFFSFNKFAVMIGFY